MPYTDRAARRRAVGAAVSHEHVPRGTTARAFLSLSAVAPTQPAAADRATRSTLFPHPPATTQFMVCWRPEDEEDEDTTEFSADVAAWRSGLAESPDRTRSSTPFFSPLPASPSTAVAAAAAESVASPFSAGAPLFSPSAAEGRKGRSDHSPPPAAAEEGAPSRPSAVDDSASAPYRTSTSLPPPFSSPATPPPLPPADPCRASDANGSPTIPPTGRPL
mmetsp:Transcript_5948/g.17164  ORF Transcript_5948/g.17164 Transcript_5948/m.17164 type:complete len:219 (+) Transcript_5948:776-1432(+)